MLPEEAKNEYQAELLLNRLTKRYRHLKKWARRNGTDAYRLYDRDIPEIPLVLDIYADAVSGALYERPYEKEEASEERWLSCMKQAVSQAIELPSDRIFIKQRKKQRGKQQYTRIARKAEYSQVTENGLSFKVNLSDYLDTGLFLDHRPTRKLVQKAASDKRILNLFCYTGSFSVHAAYGGAKQVDSVDLSNTYLDWAADNFRLNGFDAVKTDAEQFFNRNHGRHQYMLIRADVLKFLETARLVNMKWDYIILDPPTFSNSKKMDTDLDIRRDYVQLVHAALPVLEKEGTLLFSCNAKGFKLDTSAFPGIQIQDIKNSTTDEDFKDKNKRSCYTFNV